MRTFIVLCLVAVACADKLGYNYQPVEHSNSGLSFAPGAGALEGSAISSLPIDSQDLGDAQSSNGADPQGDLDKEFYSFSANEDDFNDPNASNQAVNSVKQGLRVVFIKSPENKGFEDAALALAKQAAAQKTDIYVLNKQTDIGDLANKLNAASKNANSKPEVHFVKYRTPEDAANAQQAIQSQYDSLGGPSQNINGGIAPVLNFASQGPITAPSVGAPGSGYLPSSVLRRLRFRY